MREGENRLERARGRRQMKEKEEEKDGKNGNKKR